MSRYKTRKINITYRLSKWRQRCETDSWWQTIPQIYNTLSKKISDLEEFSCRRQDWHNWCTSATQARRQASDGATDL